MLPSASGTVMLNERFKGEIATNDTLILGEKGVINADIRAGQVTVVEECVLFEGYCGMTKANQIPEVPIARDYSVVPLKRQG
jgi:cytoskeletal protein CcmA (bactofilin family)